MALRMIEAMMPDEAVGRLDTLATEVDVLGSWREPLGDGKVLLRILVRSDETEPVIAELESRFADCPDFRIVLFQAEATLPTPPPVEAEEEVPEEVPEPVAEGPEPEPKAEPEPKRVAVAELVEKLESTTRVDRAYLFTIVLSTIVAAIGLIRSDVAIIIGAMVIAPLLSPNMALAAATTLGDAKLARHALWVNGVGVALVITVAAALGLFVPFDPHVDQLAHRASVGLSDVALALAAGSAGALAFTTGVSEALVGVMVAVALVPPLAASGLFIGAGHWSMGSRALLLVATNVICVNLAAVGTFLLQEVRPRHWWDAKRAKSMVRVAAVVWLILLAILVALILFVSGW